MKDLMIDLETLSTETNAVILEIGAVEFDLETGQTGFVFNKIIDIQSCLDLGMEISAKTLKWWMKQPDKAKEIFFSKSNDLVDVIYMFSEFIGDNDYCVWGNSNRFDLNILENACREVFKESLWDFRKERDVRTLVSLFPEIKDNCVFYGVKHNAVDDCLHQIKYCHEIYKKLKPKKQLK